MTQPASVERLKHPPGVARVLELARCQVCAVALEGRVCCESCGAVPSLRDGILEAIRPLEGRNRIAQIFYESRAWERFEPWERLFLWLQGPGVAHARRKILRHLPSGRGLRLLEVGIGAGANVALLPNDWEVHGVDIAWRRLVACESRFSSARVALAHAEAESLPYVDAVFDAVLTVGGINYFRDPDRALREMWRVARPGGTLIAADERPDLFRFSPGHALGLDLLDAWCLRWMGLDQEFLDMVFHDPAPVEQAARAAWPDHRRYSIWNRLGYCLVAHREG